MKYFIILLVLTVFFPIAAFGYIDPGTGSYIFQLLIAGLLGAAFTIKSFWHQIPTMLGKLAFWKKSKSPDNES